MSYVELYRNYRIWRHSKSVNRRNKVSGHQWTEQVETSRYYVAGSGMSVNKLYNSIESARSHIDFHLKFSNLKT